MGDGKRGGEEGEGWGMVRGEGREREVMVRRRS